MKTTKHCISAFRSAFCALIAVLMLFSSAICVFAWETPELSLAADYSDSDKTLTVYLTVEHFAGTESADYRVQFDKDALEFVSCKTPLLGDNEFFISGLDTETGDRVNVAFYDMYYAPADVLPEDGSCAVATVVFNVRDGATVTGLRAYTDSCAMDPDSTKTEVAPVELDVDLTGGDASFGVSDAESSSSAPASETINSGSRKILLLIVCVAAVAVIAAGVVVIIRKKGGKK